MPAIIEFPTVVQDVVDQFGAIFANEPERRHFAEYLTGLLVAEKKTVSGINAEFAQTTDQSCLTRWITEVDWDVAKLNEQRWAGLQERAQTRYAPSGVLPIVTTLVDHSGKLLEGNCTGGVLDFKSLNLHEFNCSQVLHLGEGMAFLTHLSSERTRERSTTLTNSSS